MNDVVSDDVVWLSQVSVFGVFTCGPPALTQGVDKACAESNKYVENVLFIHHHENFWLNRLETLASQWWLF